MKASVIIPCFNCAEMIAETIQSLEIQTYKDFEVICINDGSTDDTLKRLNEIKNESKLNITILEQENLGVSKARNRGIEFANGEYLLFLDADDIYNQHFISKMITAAESNNVECAYCKLSHDLDNVRAVEAKNDISVIETQNISMQKLLFEMGSYGFYCFLYRREIVFNYNLRFDENTKYFEDREFNWKYLCLCNEFAWINLELYGYRINNNSALRRKITWKRCTDSLNAVKRIEKFLDEHHCQYSEKVKNYLYARVMWGVAKNVALSGDKEMFCKLNKEFCVKLCMKRTSKDSNKLVALASRMYLIHPMLFFYVIRAKGLLR